MDTSSFPIAGQAQQRIALTLRMANRHGLITGATGTGKTVTLQTMAEGFSRNGVPVFMADVKGDLSGLARAGATNERLQQRLQALAAGDFSGRAFPVVLWDVYGQRGHPVRATVSNMGPQLLANLLELNDVQSGVLYAVFKVADDSGLLLLDLKDLRAMLQWTAEHSRELQSKYGNLSGVSIAAIQRQLLVLEQQGAEQFFGEPSLSLTDLMQVDFSGNGVVSIFDATALMARPRVYAMFLLWLLAELFEQLPEVGDVDKPKLVFFFDEAHLLFNDAPKALVEKIEQVARLIRSKGVGIYFVTQNPLDVPDSVLGQLGNRVQHALRAFSPKDQKAVRAAAQTFRANPALDTERVITELGVGEALVSLLDEHGQPQPVQRALILPPQSRIGPLTDAERAEQLSRSPLHGRYDQVLDRESAYEKLAARAQQQQTPEPAAKAEKQPRGGEDMLAAFVKSAAHAAGSQLGRQILRGVLGSLLGGKRR
jgi:DNA helicase HerA-like ATPase